MRLIDADALTEKCGKWYTEEGTEEGFIGTVKQLLDEQPTEIGWIPFKTRPLTDEEKDHYPDLIYMFDCPLPEDGQEILVSFLNGMVWVDEWSNDCNECGLASGSDVEEGMAWMPMPEAYRREG